MGRGKSTAAKAVYAPPRGQTSFSGGGRRRSHPEHQEPVPSPNKFHVEDLKHFPKVMEVAHKVRDEALRRGRPELTGHAVEARIGDHLRAMSESEVLQSLRKGSIVEINDGPHHNDCRMLVRDDNGVCVVYSVGLHRIITCWWNDPNDTHSTLDMSNYRRVIPGDPKCRVAAETLQRTVARGYRAARR